MLSLRNSRVVIISTVRSKELRWLPVDRAQNRGLVHEPKRFNVAMTRAKELLIVVGNAETLTVRSLFAAPLPLYLALIFVAHRADLHLLCNSATRGGSPSTGSASATTATSARPFRPPRRTRQDTPFRALSSSTTPSAAAACRRRVCGGTRTPARKAGRRRTERTDERRRTVRSTSSSGGSSRRR